jgi:rRNA biogenesis protein RRP5
MPKFLFLFAVSDRTIKVGSSVKGLVLDLSDGVVNLSLKPELVSCVKKSGTKKVMIALAF